MASRKHKRYGQGGSGHKKNPNVNRPNGKAFKQHPKGFLLTWGRLVTTSEAHKGTSW